MKTLVLIRHAKSSWEDRSQTDFDRPLHHRGKTDATLMGKVLRQQRIFPDSYLVSPAKRAMATAGRLSEALGMGDEVVRTVDALYLADANTIRHVIAENGGNAKLLFVTCHNPGMTDLANQISEVRMDNLPTCGIFTVELNIAEWPEIVDNQGKFLFFDYPKNHK